MDVGLVTLPLAAVHPTERHLVLPSGSRKNLPYPSTGERARISSEDAVSFPPSPEPNDKRVRRQERRRNMRKRQNRRSVPRWKRETTSHPLGADVRSNVQSRTAHSLALSVDVVAGVSHRRPVWVHVSTSHSNQIVNRVNIVAVSVVPVDFTFAVNSPLTTPSPQTHRPRIQQTPPTRRVRRVSTESPCLCPLDIHTEGGERARC